MNEVTKEVLTTIRKIVHRMIPSVNAASIRAVKNQGHLNFIFHADLKDHKKCIIRASTNACRDGYRYFDKEIWVLNQLAQIDFPSPRVYSEIFEFSFRQNEQAGALYLCEFCEGVQASSLVEETPAVKEQLYITLGKLMSRVHQIPCPGFGAHFSAESSRFTHSWPEALQEDFKKYGFSPEIISAELSHDQLTRLEQRIQELGQLNFKGHLCHGDLNLSNLLVSPVDLSVTSLIDWERSLATLTPISSFMIITYEMLILRASYSAEFVEACFNGDGILPELRAFIEGYGISCDQYERTYRYQTESLLLTKMTPFFNWWHANTEATVRAPWQKAYNSARIVLRLLLGYSGN